MVMSREANFRDLGHPKVRHARESSEPLLTPYRMGDIDLPNRVIMAPLTRMRANPDDHVPTILQTEYYAQRASAGLIIAEATAISPEGFGWADTPGLWSEEQVRGWRRVTDAVHAATEANLEFLTDSELQEWNEYRQKVETGEIQ